MDLDQLGQELVVQTAPTIWIGQRQGVPVAWHALHEGAERVGIAGHDAGHLHPGDPQGVEGLELEAVHL